MHIHKNRERLRGRALVLYLQNYEFFEMPSIFVFFVRELLHDFYGSIAFPDFFLNSVLKILFFLSKYKPRHFFKNSVGIFSFCFHEKQSFIFCIAGSGYKGGSTDVPIDCFFRVCLSDLTTSLFLRLQM